MKTEQRAGKPVNLIDNDDVDPIGFNVCQKTFECGAIKRPPGYTTIVVTIGN